MLKNRDTKKKNKPNCLSRHFKIQPENTINFKIRVTGRFCLRLIYLNYVYGGLACMHACAPCMCLMPAEARKSNWIPWNWSYGWL